MFGRKKTKEAILNLDHYLNQLDKCGVVFKSGVKDYLEGNRESFAESLKTIGELRSSTAGFRRAIESSLYTRILILDSRADTLQLLDRLDLIVNKLYKYLYQYEDEIPFFPSELATDYLKLAEISALSVEELAKAVKDYFRNPRVVAESTHRIYYFEKEVSRQAQAIKHRVFHEMNNVKLSQKIHIRYFTLHVEELAEEAKNAADMLSVMLLKQKP